MQTCKGARGAEVQRYGETEGSEIAHQKHQLVARDRCLNESEMCVRCVWDGKLSDSGLPLALTGTSCAFELFEHARLVAREGGHAMWT